MLVFIIIKYKQEKNEYERRDKIDQNHTKEKE